MSVVTVEDFKGVGDYEYIKKDLGVRRTSDFSIRLDPDFVRGSRESNVGYHSIKPGDHVIWGCYCRCDGDPSLVNQYSGGKVGVDFYASGGVVESLPRNYILQSGEWISGSGLRSYVTTDAPPGLPQPVIDQFQQAVNQLEWKFIYWDFIVPTCYYTYISGPHTGDTVEIYGIIPWIQARYSKDNYHAWFTDPQLLINPSAEIPVTPIDLPEEPPTETPEQPTPSPTPAPVPTKWARVPAIGNRAFVQVYLRRIRDKIFSKEEHERLHPWI